MVEPNALFIVKTLEGRYVTAENSYNEFQNLFEQNYDFVLVDETFYNDEYNGLALLTGKKNNIIVNQYTRRQSILSQINNIKENKNYFSNS